MPCLNRRPYHSSLICLLRPWMSATFWRMPLFDRPTKLSPNKCWSWPQLLLPSFGDHTQFHVGPPDSISYRWSRQCSSLAVWSQNLLLANQVAALSTQSLIGISVLPWSLLNPSPTFPRLGMFISLDLMLLLGKTQSHVSLSSSNHLGRREACMEFKQESHT